MAFIFLLFILSVFSSATVVVVFSAPENFFFFAFNQYFFLLNCVVWSPVWFFLLIISLEHHPLWLKNHSQWARNDLIYLVTFSGGEIWGALTLRWRPEQILVYEVPKCQLVNKWDPLELLFSDMPVRSFLHFFDTWPWSI